MDQPKSGLRLPVLAAVDRSASYATMAEDGVVPSQVDLERLLSGLAGGLTQALPAIIGAFL
jgi:hypothetical protein